MKRSLHTRKGTSLLELILFVGITAMMTGVVLSFSLLSTQVGMREEIIADVEHSGLLASEMISQKVQAADTVNVVPGELTLTKGGVTTTFELDGSKIKVTEDGEESYLTPESLKVSELNFTLLGVTESSKRGVTVSFSVENDPDVSASELFDYSQQFHITVAGR